ncbi:LOW QUALITY PROTEIN: hypothetical protein PHMEG_00017239 [Phytophthora megakarya]|uniref:Eukaryotic/viral aspartic protease n=1 Tax=Phytophthora megakarya TaxID=4795 RepID=A0A225VX33_9STRA|nr:LOW QUALITY PROTEIN: hypothetical protein PHMEG_00017239 [Phytophthora megakarya]
MLKDAGIIPEVFNASELFDLETSVIQRSTRTLYEKLEPLVGSVTQPETAKLTPTRNPEYQAGSSQYASATSEAESDSPVDLQRMVLGPSGAEMLLERQANTKPDRSSHGPTPMATPRWNQWSPTTTHMESTQLEHRHTSTSGDRIRRSGLYPSTTTPHIRVSAISELKEYSVKDHAEDRSMSWLGKVKSAFVCDQAPDSEKYLVLGNLLTGSARNRYRQLSRSTRSNWKSWFEAFQTPYCGRGVSVARPYYNAKKRSDQSPLEYLHRLNVAGLRAKPQVKDGPLGTRPEHVEYFIETLDDRDLADPLELLRLTDAEDLEETLWGDNSRKPAKGKPMREQTRSGRRQHPNLRQRPRRIREQCE